jgi:hypothetical protein
MKNIVKVKKESHIDNILENNRFKLVLLYFSHSDSKYMSQLLGIKLRKFLKRTLSELDDVMIVYVDLKEYERSNNKYTGHIRPEMLPYVMYMFDKRLTAELVKADVESLHKCTCDTKEKIDSVMKDKTDDKLKEKNDSVIKDKTDNKPKEKNDFVIKDKTDDKSKDIDVKSIKDEKTDNNSKDIDVKSIKDDNTLPSLVEKEQILSQKEVKPQEEKQTIIVENQQEEEINHEKKMLEQHEQLKQQLINQVKLEKIEELKKECVVKELERVKLSKDNTITSESENSKENEEENSDDEK